MAKFFSTPFATLGTKGTIPESNTESVSWESGYTENYEFNTLTSNDAKHVERDLLNALFYEITAAIKELQTGGVAPFFEEVMESTGYAEGAVVSLDGQIWRSKIPVNKAKPSLNTKDNWEPIYGYDTLKDKLSIDSANAENLRLQGMNKNLSLDTSSQYLRKEIGEIYLLTWCDDNRNNEGFFLCNGEKLSYDLNDETLFFGNQLYRLCHEETNEFVDSEFKKRWAIKVDKGSKTIQLPNILGVHSDGTAVAEKAHVLLGMGKQSSVPTLKDSISMIGMSDFTDNAYVFKMLPCIYLGVPHG